MEFEIKNTPLKAKSKNRPFWKSQILTYKGLPEIACTLEVIFS
jgi:hypothetical protein